MKRDEIIGNPQNRRCGVQLEDSGDLISGHHRARAFSEARWERPERLRMLTHCEVCGELTSIGFCSIRNAALCSGCARAVPRLRTREIGDRDRGGLLNMSTAFQCMGAAFTLAAGAFLDFTRSLDKVMTAKAWRACVNAARCKKRRRREMWVRVAVRAARKECAK